MADHKEPKKETVRITLPPPPGGPSAAPGAAGRETARINLPARPPANGMAPRPPGAAVARPPQAQTPLPPAPAKAVARPPLFRQAPVPPPAAAAAAPAGAPPSMPRPAAVPPPPPPAAAASSNFTPRTGPKKETARISVLPEPASRPAPTVEMKKTQPLLNMPHTAPQTAPIAINVEPSAVETFIEELPMPLCWALLVVSIVVLTIQIWNYVS